MAPGALCPTRPPGAIAAYLGGTDTFDHAVTDFALAYADQTATDHAALDAAVTAGVLTAAQGV